MSMQQVQRVQQLAHQSHELSTTHKLIPGALLQRHSFTGHCGPSVHAVPFEGCTPGRKHHHFYAGLGTP